MIPCKCGCGELIAPKDRLGRTIRFKYGHGNRKQQWTPALDELIQLLYCLHGSCRSVGRAIGVASQMVNYRLRKLGVTINPIARQPLILERNPNWAGGINHRAGYIRKIVRSKKYVFEHRTVMENVLGRPLLPTEVVHHINGDKADNRPENLELFGSHSAHMKEHASQRARRHAENSKSPLSSS